MKETNENESEEQVCSTRDSALFYLGVLDQGELLATARLRVIGSYDS